MNVWIKSTLIVIGSVVGMLLVSALIGAMMMAMSGPVRALCGLVLILGIVVVLVRNTVFGDE